MFPVHQLTTAASTLVPRCVPILLRRSLTTALQLSPDKSDNGDDVKPWSNEYSVSGTTWETVMHSTTTNATVDPELEMRELEGEIGNMGFRGNLKTMPSVLTWSAANSQISSWCASEREAAASAIAFPREPWIARHQPPRPHLQRGLFKPVYKPLMKHLE